MGRDCDGTPNYSDELSDLSSELSYLTTEMLNRNSLIPDDRQFLACLAANIIGAIYQTAGGDFTEERVFYMARYMGENYKEQEK